MCYRVFTLGVGVVYLRAAEEHQATHSAQVASGGLAQRWHYHRVPEDVSTKTVRVQTFLR